MFVHFFPFFHLSSVDSPFAASFRRVLEHLCVFFSFIITSYPTSISCFGSWMRCYHHYHYWAPLNGRDIEALFLIFRFFFSGSAFGVTCDVPKRSHQLPIKGSLLHYSYYHPHMICSCLRHFQCLTWNESYRSFCAWHRWNDDEQHAKQMENKK